MEDELTLEMLLREVEKIHTNKINEVLDEFHMHKGQPLMLYLLEIESGIPQSKLAKKMHITTATVSAMVKRLEKRGMVIRKRDAIDERISNVYLTAEGRKMHKTLQDQRFDMEGLVFSDFTSDEKETMQNYLKRILENLNK